MSRAFDPQLIREEMGDDEPTLSEALELWEYLENPREMLKAGRRERNRVIGDD